MPSSARLFFCATLLALSSVAAHAQNSQKLEERIYNPDLSRAYSPADRQFDAGSSANDKKASVKSFAFNRSAYVRDGYRTTAYSGSHGYDAKTYNGAREAAASGKTFGENDRAFATREAGGVRDARDSNKTLAVREYSSSSSGFVPNGKSQDRIDQLMGDKNLTVDQVRDILNKNK